MPSIKNLLEKYRPVVAQTVRETKGRDYVTAGDRLNFAVRSAFDKLRIRNSTTTPQQPVTTTPQQPNPAQNIPIRALPQPGISSVNPELNNPAQNIPIRALPRPGIPNPPSAPIPGFHELPLVITNPGYEEFIKNATEGFNQTKTGQQYQTALQALEAFKKANPSPGSYSGYGADPQLKAQYDQVYGNYQQAMIPYFQGLSEYQKEYKTQGLV